MSAISLIQPDRDLSPGRSTGPPALAPRRSCRCREKRWINGWDSCDIILVTGDAYVDHPSFGMAICGRMLEAQGFRVGIISQPDWNNKTILCAWVNRICSSASPPATWIR